MSQNQAEKLLETAQENSKIVRNAFISYLAVAVFIWITVESVTHRQLLIPTERLTLPVINVQIPVVGFFWVAPLFLLLFHLFFVLHVLKFAELLKKIRDENESGDAWKHQLHGNLFTWVFFAKRTGNPFSMQLARLLIVVSFWLVGPVILLRTQIVFLPYHAAALTFLHRLLFSGSIFLNVYFCAQIYSLQHQGFRERIAETLREFILPRGFFKNWHSTENLFNVGGPAFVIAAVPFLLVFSWDILVIPQTAEENEAKFAWWYGPFAGKSINLVVARNLNLAEAKLAKGPGETLRAALIDKPQEEREAELLQHYEILDLQGRHLEFADLSNTDLKKADLRNTHLRGANLRRADLQNADFFDAGLQGADFGIAHLQGADFRIARLQGAVLILARLQGAKLINAHLQGANLNSAHLQGADLSKADLQGANVRRTHLQGALLKRANLQGANLNSARLQGAILRDTNLTGAVLVEARLQGADFSFADLSELEFDEQQLENWAEEIPEITIRLNGSKIFPKKGFLKRMTARKGKPAQLKLTGNPLLIRHSYEIYPRKQPQLARVPNLTQLEVREEQKKVWSRLICEYPILRKQKFDVNKSSDIIAKRERRPFETKQEVEAAIRACDASEQTAKQ